MGTALTFNDALPASISVQKMTLAVKDELCV